MGDGAMTHRFAPLESFEAELRGLAEGSATKSRRRAALVPFRGRVRWGLLVPIAVLLLAGGTLALAATGVILTGAAVPVTAPVGPSEGVGVPVSSHLLGLRVQDPDGGPPWGMRIVETSRGLVCAQVGRVHDGQLGEIGRDGAFGDDGLFHPFPSEVVQTFPGGSTEDGTEIDGGTCALAGSAEWGSAVAAELWAVDRNAAFAGGPPVALPTAQKRDISYGILGPRGLSVTYREGSAVRSESVVPGVGAYLIVQPGAASDHQGSGEAPGTQTPGYGPGTDGALATITYEQNGSTCENGYDARTGAKVAIARACPPPRAPAPAAPASSASSSQVHPAVRLRVRSHRVIAADVSFAAPFPVRGAAEGYSLWSKGCGPKGEGSAAAVFNRDVARGATVHMELADPFAARCSQGSVPIEILFDSSVPSTRHSAGQAPGQVAVATVTVRLPAGDRAAGPPEGR
jgi:hypothetical protein